ncbi:MAG: hypothetical protein AAF572_20155 [Cyanobacteria bacterium P01_B01_bin.77]
MTEINNANKVTEPADDLPTDDGAPEKYVQKAASFIENTSLDKMIEMADEAVRKKMIARATQPRKWVMPEDLES